MDILFLTVNLGGGGAEKVLVNLANQLAARGHHITIRSLVDEGVNKKIISPSVRYEYVFKRTFPGMGKIHLLPHGMMYRLVAHGEYDIIIPYLQGVLTRIVAFAPKKQRKIAWLHADMGACLSLFKKEELPQVWGSYKNIVAVSSVAKESFERMSGITGRTKVLYNTFDANGIREKGQESIDDVFEPGSIKLCSVGKLEKIKGYLRLLKVVKKLWDGGLHCSLAIVGEGVQRTELEQFIAEESMQEYVRLMGFDSNPYKYIAHSDLFVCSSFTEGFSSVVAESLILGTPVLTTDCAGMVEMLGEKNEYGMIVENSEEGLYNGLEQLLSEKDLLLHFKAKAQERSPFFEPERTVSAVEELFREVMENEP